MNHQCTVILRVCLCGCLALLSLSLQAQSVLKGQVEDEQHQGLPAVTLRILNRDSTFVAGGLTDDRGAFRVGGVKAGRYILSVSSIGYRSRLLDFDMPDADYVLPPVVLKEESAMLKGVTVTGSSFIQKKDHLLVIPDKSTVRHSFGGYDLLYNLMVPGLTVDRRNKTVTSLAGEAALYINGVKADMREIEAL